MKSMEIDSIDMIFTSPPYADRRKSTYGGVKSKEYVKWITPILMEMKRVIKPSGSIFINLKSHCEDGQRDLYVYRMVISAVDVVGLKFVDEFAWTKNGFPGAFHGRFKNGWEPIYHFIKGELNQINFNPLACGTPMKESTKTRITRIHSGKNKNDSGFVQPNFDNYIGKETARPSNVIHIDNVVNMYSKNIKHPATFPVKLAEWFIKSFSHKDDTIYDPFTGSGTVGLACKNLFRNFIGSELEAEYIPIITDTIKNGSGAEGKTLEW